MSENYDIMKKYNARTMYKKLLTLEEKTQEQQSPQNTFKTPDDDQRWLKHVVDNVVFKISLKDALCICSKF
jgi:hypothetical protein